MFVLKELSIILSRNRGPNRGLPTSCFGFPSPQYLVSLNLCLMGRDKYPPHAFLPKGGGRGHRLVKQGCQNPSVASSPFGMVHGNPSHVDPWTSASPRTV